MFGVRVSFLFPSKFLLDDSIFWVSVIRVVVIYKKGFGALFETLYKGIDSERSWVFPGKL